MRVLKVMPGVTPDAGTERSLLAIAPGLVRRGVSLHLAVLTNRQVLVGELERIGVVVHDLSGRTGLSSRVRAIRRVVSTVSPDLVHASLFEATLPTQLALLGGDVPLLVSWANTNYGPARTVEPGSSRAKVAGVQQVEMVLGRLTHTRYHAVTPAVGTINSEYLRVKPCDVFVGERGRDPQRFRPGISTSVDLLPPAVGGGPRQIVLAVGRQEPQKGYETLLRSFDELAATHARAELMIAGRVGSSTPEICRVHDSMRHGNAVHFLGQRDDIADLMAAADLVVCSSWREGAAGSLIEAMACATPIVSVELPGLDGILRDGDNAVVVPRAELASGMARVLDDPALGTRLAASALRTFEDRFTIEGATDRMIEIYREVIAAGQRNRAAPDAEPAAASLPRRR